MRLDRICEICAGSGCEVCNEVGFTKDTVSPWERFKLSQNYENEEQQNERRKKLDEVLERVFKK